jgi:hypothetical protein
VDGHHSGDEEVKNVPNSSVSKKRRSPKKRIHKDKESESDDSYYSDEYYDDGFIVGDEEVEQEILEGIEQEKQIKKKKKKRPNRPVQAENEDFELIKENTGIELKKRSRLKRNADSNVDATQVKKEIEVSYDNAQ